MSDPSTWPPADLRGALERLAAFLPELSTPDVQYGEWRGGQRVSPGVLNMPWFEQSELVMRFTSQAYADGWVRMGFRWSDWAGTDEARPLLHDPGAISGLQPETLANLITCYIRADRFVEGALADAFETGMIRAIVEQAGRLARDSQG